MNGIFLPRTRLRAFDLNELGARAESAHLGGASYLSADNGFEQVARNPRRQIARGGGAAAVAAENPVVGTITAAQLSGAAGVNHKFSFAYVDGQTNTVRTATAEGVALSGDPAREDLEGSAADVFKGRRCLFHKVVVRTIPDSFFDDETEEESGEEQGGGE